MFSGEMILREPIPPIIRWAVIHRDKSTCRYCGRYLKQDIELDHVIPVVRGGSTNIANLVTACRPCNRRKGTRLWKPTSLELSPMEVRAKIAEWDRTRKRGSGTTFNPSVSREDATAAREKKKLRRKNKEKK